MPPTPGTISGVHFPTFPPFLRAPCPCEDSWGSDPLQGAGVASPHLPEGGVLGPSILSLGRIVAELVGWYLGCAVQLTCDLGDDIPLGHCVLGCFMRHVGGHEADEPPSLMHYSIHTGHL